MAKTKILHIQGNEITIGFPVKEVNAVLHDGSSSTVDKTEALSELWVVLRRGILVRQYKVYPAHDYVFFTDKGHLPCGAYDLEVFYDTEDGQHMRLSYPQILTIVDSTEAGQIYESDDFDVDAYYPIVNGRSSAVVITENSVMLQIGGRIGTDEDGDDENTINAEYGDGSITETDDEIIINI